MTVVMPVHLRNEFLLSFNKRLHWAHACLEVNKSSAVGRARTVCMVWAPSDSGQGNNAIVDNHTDLWIGNGGTGQHWEWFVK